MKKHQSVLFVIHIYYDTSDVHKRRNTLKSTLGLSAISGDYFLVENFFDMLKKIKIKINELLQWFN